jgi:murein DD-endopeptidase MepM/ murein hydrolase activator NlpD
MTRVAWVVFFLLTLEQAVSPLFSTERSPSERLSPGSLWVYQYSPAEGEQPQLFFRALGHQWPLYPLKQKRIALVAIPASTPPGRYKGELVTEEGSVLREETFRVYPKTFPVQHIQMPPKKTRLMDPRLLKKERALLYSALSQTCPVPLWKGTFWLPVKSRVTSDFGRIRYVNGRFWSQHSGLDLASPAGTKIYAGNRGKVVMARKLWMRGNTLVLDHGLGLMSIYNHLSRFLVKEGEEVERGQPIGEVGATGFVTGPHLHWEIRVGTVPVNPWPLLRRPLSF